MSVWPATLPPGDNAIVRASVGWLALGILASAAHARPAVDEREVHLPELALTLSLPPLDGFVSKGKNRWEGRLGSSVVKISLKTLATETYGFLEPEGVLDQGPSFWASPEQGRNEPGARRVLEGPFGYASYAAYERSELLPRGGGKPLGLRYLLASLLPDAGYWITLEAAPPPSTEDEARLFEFLSGGIRYEGEVRVHEWTDAEAEERWKREAPDSTHGKFVGPIRTAHYIVLTDSSGGKKFGKKLEACHDAIREAFPFEDVAGRRLMPVFLFRDAEEYFEFIAGRTGIDREVAARTKGYAWGDFYATWNGSIGDPVHIHEATHQIFANRLGLAGGGSWFQEGVAEYMSSKPSERSAAAGQAKKGRHTPLAELVSIPDLSTPGDGEARGESSGHPHRLLAALWIEFLREDKELRDAFPEFLLRIGRLGRGERREIEAVLQDLYGVDLEGLEQLWIEYCRQR